MSTTQVTEADVVVVGAGPAGLTTAIELGRRGIDTIVADAGERGAYKSPRTMLINDRSMEHLRRWGIADRLREDNPIDPELVPDIIFATTLTGHPLHRFVRPFVGTGRDNRIAERAEWTPQLRIEGTLREHAETFPSVSFLWEHAFTGLTQDADGVVATFTCPDGLAKKVRAGHLVGADGSHSLVRKNVGVRMEGRSHLLRAAKYHVVAPLKARAQVGNASFYWFVNGAFDAGTSVLLNALDAADGWGLSCYPVPAGMNGDDHDAMARILFSAVGEEVPVRFISGRAWNMHALVAPTFRVGRVFLAGDAAHLMPNLGGFGMNSSLLDAVDLGWKLAASLQGWGGERLLDSYDLERRPAVQWVLAQQVANASILSGDLYRPGLETSGPAGDMLREEVGREVERTKRAEFSSLGVQKGYRYDDSPVLVLDGTPPAPQDPVEYVQSGRPGCVAPHRWLGTAESLYDRFGPEWTLLRLGPDAPDPGQLVQAARHARLPLAILEFPLPAMAEEYGARLALIRPDQHVAWRGDEPPEAPERIVNAVRGA